MKIIGSTDDIVVLLDTKVNEYVSRIKKTNLRKN